MPTGSLRAWRSQAWGCRTVGRGRGPPLFFPYQQSPFAGPVWPLRARGQVAVSPFWTG